MNLDRDLADALAPIGGDPVHDAARVLAALGPGGAAPRPPRWLPWVLGGALLAGLGIGVVLGVSLAGAPPPPAAAPAPKPAEPAAPNAGEQPKPAEPPPKPPTEKLEIPSAEQAEYLELMAFGPLDIDEPGEGPQHLEAGAWRARVGTKVVTEEGFAGIYMWANDARVRLDRSTEATVAATDIDLRFGRVWFSTIDRPTAFVVRTGIGAVQSEGAVVQLDLRGQDLRIAVFDGIATLRTSGGEARPLPSGSQVVVAAAGSVGTPEPIAFSAALDGWMVPMVVLQQDDRELRQRVGAMVGAWLEGTHRLPAGQELRRLGSRAVPDLVKAIERTPRLGELAVDTAELIADLAESSQAAWLLPLLDHEMASVRTAIFRGLVRATGVPYRDEAFWRAADPSVRSAAREAWQAALR